MTTINRRLALASTGQLGAITREQAHELGVSDAQLRSRVQSGFLTQPGTNVFRLGGAGVDPRTALSDLQADVGGLVVASRFTAAALLVALRRQGMHGIPRLVEVIEGVELSRGAHSWLESEFLRLMAKSGVERPEPQVISGRAGNRLIRVDFRFPGTTVVVEVLGYRWHRSPAHSRRDTERMNAMISDGMRPFQFTYQEIVESPDQVVRVVQGALAG